MAPRTIKQRISLDGGEEIKGLLKAIGDAGRKAFLDIENAAREAGDAQAPLVARFDKLRASYKALQAETNRLGLATRNFKLALADLSSSAGTFITRFGLLSAAVVGAGYAFGRFASSSAASIDQVGKTAEELGVTIEQYQKLQFAAEQSGRAGDVFQQAFSKISVAIGEAERAAAEGVAGLQQIGEQARQTGETINGVTVFRPGGATQSGLAEVKDEATGAVGALNELKVRLLDANGAGRNAYDVFLDTAEALRNVTNDTTRARLGNALFGEEYRKLLPLLKDGRLGIEQLGEEAVKLGIVLSQQDYEVAKQFADESNKLGRVFENLRNRVFLAVGPALTEALTAFTQYISDNRVEIEKYATGIVEDITSILGDVPALLKFDDAAVENKWLIDLRDGFIALKDSAIFAFDAIRSAFATLSAILQPVADAINNIFGTNLTGAALLVVGIVLQLTGGFRLLWAAVKLGGSSVRLIIGFYGWLRKLGPVISSVGGLIARSLVGRFRQLRDAIAGALGRGGGAGTAAAIEGIGTAAKKAGTEVKSVGTAAKSAGTAARGSFGSIGRAAASAGTAVVGLASAPVAVGVAFGALAVATVVYWDDIKGAVAAGWEATKRVLSEAQEGVAAFGRDVWGLLASSAEKSWNGIVTVVSDGWAGVRQVTETAAAAIDTAAGDVWAAITDRGRAALTAAETVARDTWAGIGAVTASAKSGLSIVAADTWSAIEDGARGLAARVSPIWDDIRDTARTALATVATTVLEAWTSATTTVEDSARAIKDAITRATEIAGDVAGAQDLAAQLVAPFLDAKAQIEAIVASFAGIAEDGLSSVLTVVDNIADAIERRIADLISRLRAAAAEARKLASESSSSSSGGSTTGGLRTVEQTFATGGMVYGAGTKTSDSILARLSRGEFVIRAAAVDKYGPGLLAAINGLRFKMPKFASGGLVGGQQIRLPSFDGVVSGINASLASMVPAPAFAGGGLVPQMASGGRPLILDLGGGKQISAGTVGQDVVVELMRAAKGRSSAQIGRKPGWAGA